MRIENWAMRIDQFLIDELTQFVIEELVNSHSPILNSHPNVPAPFRTAFTG